MVEYCFGIAVNKGRFLAGAPIYGNVAERLCNSLITSTTWVQLPPFTTKHTMP